MFCLEIIKGYKVPTRMMCGVVPFDKRPILLLFTREKVGDFACGTLEMSDNKLDLYITAQKECTCKKFFLRSGKEVLFSADCRLLELESRELPELLSKGNFHIVMPVFDHFLKSPSNYRFFDTCLIVSYQKWEENY